MAVPQTEGALEEIGERHKREAQASVSMKIVGRDQPTVKKSKRAANFCRLPPTFHFPIPNNYCFYF